MTSAAKVADIFMAAGAAFSKLGEMTMELHKDEAKASSSGKWSDEEIELLKEAVFRFGKDIEKISQMVRSRTARQIKDAIRRRNLVIGGFSSANNDATVERRQSTETQLSQNKTKPTESDDKSEAQQNGVGGEINKSSNDSSSEVTGPTAKKIKTNVSGNEHDDVDVENETASMQVDTVESKGTPTEMTSQIVPETTNEKKDDTVEKPMEDVNTETKKETEITEKENQQEQKNDEMTQVEEDDKESKDNKIET